MEQFNNIDDHCITNSFKEWKPNGNCWGDGHYEYKNCIHYRDYFKRLGQDYIDFVHRIQDEIKLIILK